MDESQFRKVVVEQLRQLGLDALGAYHERLLTPDMSTVEDLRKGAELALKGLGFMQPEKQTNFIPVEIHIGHGGTVQITQDAPKVEHDEVIDVEAKDTVSDTVIPASVENDPFSKLDLVVKAH